MSDELNSLQQSQAAKRQTLAEWRASRLRPLEGMPSGLPGVVIRDLSLLDIIMMDGVEIPNTLVDMMLDNDAKQLENAQDAISDSELVLKMMKSKGDFSKMLDEIARIALVEPQIGERADDAHITLEELSFEDKLHIFTALNREPLAVRPFRDEGQTGQAAPRGGGVRPQAE